MFLTLQATLDVTAGEELRKFGKIGVLQICVFPKMGAAKGF